MIIADEMRPITKQSTQTGAVLFTALVMMVLMTLLAVTMMGNTAMDEKMAQNSQDKNRAFQGAETGIELAIADPNTINTSCTTGEPSTPNIALLPPLNVSTLPSRLSLIIVGNFPMINGGRNAHSSDPVFALNA